MGKVHELKTWPRYYKFILSGAKKWEYRKDDRQFQSGDVLMLKEYDEKTGTYTGAGVFVLVKEVWRNLPGMPEGYCIMDITMSVSGTD